MASSTFGGDPAVAPPTPSTAARRRGWYASPVDAAPALQLTWGRNARSPHVRAVLRRGQPGELPDVLVVDPMKRDEDVQLVATTGPNAGVMNPVRTKRLLVSVLPGTELDDAVGISELEIGGLEDLKYTPDPDAATGVVCGFGPTVEIGGTAIQTRVTGTISDVVSGAELELEPCGTDDIAVGSGTQRIRVTNPSGFAVSRLWLVPDGTPRTPPAQ